MNTLNESQYNAVMYNSGPSLIIAGAGSGKTRVLTYKVAQLIREGYAPNSILVLTFTNKAAGEIKERIIKVIGDEAKKITVGTFHSICNRILRQYGERIGYCKTFTILSEDDADKIFKKAAKQYALEMKDLKFYVAECKAKMLTPSKALSIAQGMQVDLANAYQLYQDELKRTQSMDFDDLLLNTVMLLEQHADVKEALNNKWKFLEGDEIQDSSETDARLMELLAGEDQNVFFVGDDFQSIYGFRHANVELMLKLKDRYPNVKGIDI